MDKTIIQVKKDILNMVGKSVNYKRLFDIYNHYTFDKDKFELLDRSVAYVHQETFTTKDGETHYLSFTNDSTKPNIYVIVDYLYVIRGYYVSN